MIDRAALIKAGIISSNKKNPIKLLAGKLLVESNLMEKMNFQVDAVSDQAKEKIIQAKGTVELTPKKERNNFKENKKTTNKVASEAKETTNRK